MNKIAGSFQNSFSLIPRLDGANDMDKKTFFVTKEGKTGTIPSKEIRCFDIDIY